MRNKINLALVVIVGLAVWIGCTEANQNTGDSGQVQPMVTATATPEAVKKREPNTADAIVDIPFLANKSAKEVDAELGSPIEIDKIPANRETAPGEFRNYKIEGLKDSLQVRFHNDKAVQFVMNFTDDFRKASPEALISLGGFEWKFGDKAGALTVKWNGTFGGVEFHEVKAFKDQQGFYSLVADVTK